ncbi:MAG: DUF4129 domain-containing protein [Lachnospiraceae bacterium]|nr:DUF4129 domain-containing protein [Lachnospiraceae bacterium]
MSKLIASLLLSVSRAFWGICVTTLLVYGMATDDYKSLWGLLIFSPAAFVVNRIFLLKERKVSLIAVINVLLAVAGIAMMYAFNAYVGIGSIIFVTLVIIYLTSMSLLSVIKVPTQNKLVLGTEVSAILFIAFNLYVTWNDFDNSASMIMAVPVALCLLGSIALKMEHNFSISRLIVMAAIICAFVGASALFIRFGAESAGDGMKAFVGAIIKALKSFWAFVERILSAIFNGESTVEAVGAGASDAMQLGEDDAIMEIGNEYKYMLVGIIAVIVAGVAAVAVFVFRNVKLKGIKVEGLERPAIRNKGTGFFKSLKERILVSLWLLKNKNTPAGRYFSLERKYKKSKLGKIPGETPREYLTRLSENAKEEKDRLHLAALADDFDRFMYS